MHRTRWLAVSVLLIVGLVWVLQGLGLLRGSSFMVDDPAWAVAGVTLISVAAIVAVVTVRRRGA